ncbi:MAG: DUF2269 domain-containing protein [Alphaproteobacteria bacterium]|nr:DUF2269 domain-containing protein [Alphaproteobacteria bacterium]
MDTYLIVKTLHILSGTVLFGTGTGIAFFMLRSHFTDNLHEKLYAARNTVLADYVFTLPAVIVQPLSGAWLVWQGSYGWDDLWLVITYILYIIAGACWLPVVWIQVQLKTMIAGSLETNTPLPERYNRLFKLWFILGWPAFTGLVIIFFLMVMKPV